MKNIHILPTDKPSRLHFTEFFEELVFTPKYEKLNGVNIYITSDEELSLGGYHFNSKYGDEPQKTNQRDIDSRKYWEEEDYFISKIILTTDQDLIKDGIQAIDDEFLEWFVKNPSCGEIQVEKSFHWDNGVYEYEIIIPKEEHEIYTQDDYFNDEFPKEKQSTKERILSETSDEVKQRVRDRANSLVNKEETLSEAAEKYVEINVAKNVAKLMYKEHFVEGAKWQQERSYSEEDMKEAFKNGAFKWRMHSAGKCFEEWFEQFKKEQNERFT